MSGTNGEDAGMGLASQVAPPSWEEKRTCITPLPWPGIYTIDHPMPTHVASVGHESGWNATQSWLGVSFHHGDECVDHEEPSNA